MNHSEIFFIKVKKIFNFDFEKFSNILYSYLNHINRIYKSEYKY